MSTDAPAPAVASTVYHYTIILLSPGATHVLLKAARQSCWTFPNLDTASKGAELSCTISQLLHTAVHLELTAERPVQAHVVEVTDADPTPSHLCVVPNIALGSIPAADTGIRSLAIDQAADVDSTPFSSPVASVDKAALPAMRWTAVSDLQQQPDVLAPEAARVVPHLNSFLQRQLHLRVEAADPELTSLVTYEAAAWMGTQPREHLAEYCRLHELPAPCYSLVVKKSASRQLITSSCILPHLGMQVTPEHYMASREDAEQAAALSAMLYLEGALSVHGPHVRLVPVGFPPLLQPGQLAGFVQNNVERQRVQLIERLDQKRQKLEQQLAELERTQAALEIGGDAAEAAVAAALALEQGNFFEVRPPRPAKRARTVTVAAGGSTLSSGDNGAAPHLKSVVQELKELCDQRKWQQPEYEYEAAVGGFKCNLSLATGGLPAVTSGASAATKKSAKEAAASLALQQLAHLTVG